MSDETKVSDLPLLLRGSIQPGDYLTSNVSNRLLLVAADYIEKKLIESTRAVIARRMWVNQPSVLQSLHGRHGERVLVLPDFAGRHRCYTLSGPEISFRAPTGTLSEGWASERQGLVASLPAKWRSKAKRLRGQTAGTDLMADEMEWCAEDLESTLARQEAGDADELAKSREYKRWHEAAKDAGLIAPTPAAQAGITPPPAPVGQDKPTLWKLLRKNHLTGEWVDDAGERWGVGEVPQELADSVAAHPDYYRLKFAYERPAPPAAQADHSPSAGEKVSPAEEPMWKKIKPSGPGIYAVRGYHYGHPKDYAVVEVVERSGDLTCNLHQRTSEWPLSDRYDARIEDMGDRFEWMFLAPPIDQQAGKGSA